MRVGLFLLCDATELIGTEKGPHYLHFWFSKRGVQGVQRPLWHLFCFPWKPPVAPTCGLASSASSPSQDQINGDHPRYVKYSQMRLDFAALICDKFTYADAFVESK